MTIREAGETMRRPKTILVTAMSATMGGGIVVAQRVVEGVARLRPECRVLLCCSHAEVASYGYPKNVEIVLKPELLSRRARWIWEQFTQPGFVSENGVDVVLALGGYLSFRTRVPQIAVWQNSNVFTPPGIRRPLAEAVLVRVQRIIQSHSMRRAAQNVFLSKNSVELASRFWPMERVKHCVIYSGVDLGDSEPRETPSLDEREALVLSVGQIYSHKNYEALIDAMAVYRARHDDDVRLEIIGAAVNPTYFEELKKRIVDRGIADRVTMLGPMSHSDVLDKMLRARLYVVTSLLETFGLTLLEAMGQGLPVVASDAACHTEIGGDAAIYCDPYDPEQIADQIHRGIHDPDLAQGLRDRGLRRPREFSWTGSAHLYLDELDAAFDAEARMG